LGVRQDFLNSLNGNGIAVAQVIDHHSGMSRRIKLYQRMGTDKPGAASHKDIHNI
jgi:hypothetical protein